MNELPKEIIIEILDYLDNSDWYQCLKASKLFLVDNEVTIKQRQRLWYPLQVVIKSNNIADLIKLFKRGRLYSDVKKRNILKRYLEQVLPIQSIRDNFLSELASYIMGKFENKAYIFYGDGKNGKKDLMFFIECLFLTLGPSLPNPDNYLSCTSSDDEAAYLIKDDNSFNDINENDVTSSDTSSDDEEDNRRLFAYKGDNNIPGHDYHQKVNRLYYETSGMGYSFCVSKNDKHLVLSCETCPDFEVFKYNENGEIVLTDTTNLYQEQSRKRRSSVVLLPFISHFVEEPKNRFEFKCIEHFDKIWRELETEFLILLCELVCATKYV